MTPLPGISRAMTGFALAAALASGAGAAGETPPRYEEIRKIDVHSHVFEDLPALNALFRKINLRTINVCVPGGDGHLQEMHRIAQDLFRRNPDLYPFTATFDVTRCNEPGYADLVIGWLDQQFRAGALAVKIWKEVGIEIKDRDGRFILPDDPRFDPIYAHIAKSGRPLHAHLAEPIDAWRPLDPDSPHYGYYSQNSQWHLYGKPAYPSHAAIIAARDRIMEKHPTLVVIGAHLGSLEHDLAGIAERLERYPNFHIEVAARTRNLARHPSDQVRALFQRFPDRILYGVDMTWKPYLQPRTPTAQQRQGHVNTLELRYRADFDYYAGQGEMSYGGRKTEALNLPRAVLEKFYHANAERIYRLPVAALPAGPAAPQASTTRWQAFAERAARRVLAQFAAEKLERDQLAFTVLDLRDPARPAAGSFRGDTPIYPASVVKLFYLAAAHRWLEDGKLADTPELQRALRDMMVDSSNDATAYVVDLLTGTTSGPELPAAELKAWFDARNVVNRHFAALGYTGINVNKKPWGDGPYGRETQATRDFDQKRNMLTTEATARLLLEMATGRCVTAERSAAMMALLARKLPPPNADPEDQANFIGPALPTGAKLWSKAGWTSTARHDAACVELPGGAKFILVAFTTGHAKNPEILRSLTRAVTEEMSAPAGKP